jgi:hypothetical protein
MTYDRVTAQHRVAPSRIMGHNARSNYLIAKKHRSKISSCCVTERPNGFGQTAGGQVGDENRFPHSQPRAIAAAAQNPHVGR